MSLRGAPPLKGRNSSAGGSSLVSDLPGFGSARRGGAVDSSDLDALFAVRPPNGFSYGHKKVKCRVASRPRTAHAPRAPAPLFSQRYASRCKKPTCGEGRAFAYVFAPVSSPDMTQR
jgi:hypothetical protein